MYHLNGRTFRKISRHNHTGTCKNHIVKKIQKIRITLFETLDRSSSFSSLGMKKALRVVN